MISTVRSLRVFVLVITGLLVGCQNSSVPENSGAAAKSTTATPDDTAAVAALEKAGFQIVNKSDKSVLARKP